MIRIFLLILLLTAPALPVVAQAGHPLHLCPGTDIKVTLEENATTGDLWSLAQEPGNLRVLENRCVRRSTDRRGAPGFRVFRIRATGLGKAKLVFQCRRAGGREGASVRAFTVPVEVTPRTSPTEVLTEAVFVRPGTRFTVSLDSNASTGYSWTAPRVARTSVVKALEPRSHGSESTLPGAGGTTDFVFEGLRQGTSQVTSTYQRPFGPDHEPARTLFLLVEVAP